MRRHFRNGLLLSLLVLTTVAVTAWTKVYLDYQQPLPPMTVKPALNGLWAKHAWVDRVHSADAYRAYAALLNQHRISDLFVHVGPLDGQGRIEPHRYQHAPHFIRTLKAACPALHIQAWVGQVEKQGGGPLDLAAPSVLPTIVQTAKTLLETGFDGIHYDIEPIRSGDAHFLTLLRETHRLTQAQQRITSVAAFKMLPIPGPTFTARPIARLLRQWDPAYSRAIAANVDQMAVMMYDTALPYDFLYGAATRAETRWLIRTIGSRIPLFIGIPTYDDQRWTFHAEAENMTSGLRGVRQAIASLSVPQTGNLGVSIYADWTTDPSEWQTYRALWLDSPP